MGFGGKWIRWIKGCLSSSRDLVLINRFITKEFLIIKGVRKGDPLSPFLFFIVMEGLGLSMNSAYLKSLFRCSSIPMMVP